MKIHLIVTGKTKEEYLSAGMAVFLKRLKHYVPFSVITLKSRKASDSKTLKVKEGEVIMDAIPEGSYTVLLDESGKMYNSVDFAGQMQKWMNTGRDMCFIIGGAYGFSEEIKQRADAVLSLSRMTYSHQMVRLIFLEQLYRALTILKGEKYHNT